MSFRKLCVRPLPTIDLWRKIAGTHNWNRRKSFVKISSAVRCTIVLTLATLLLTACLRDPSTRKAKYFQSGQQYMENGHYAEAVIEFDNAIKIDSNYADARYQLAKAYLKLQQWPRAYEELKRVVELQPENYAAHFDLAKILIANGSFQQAQEQIDFLRQKQPNDSKTHFIFATLLAAQANYSEAIPEMQRAIALDPSNWDSYLNLALMQMKNNQADSAEANFKKA